MENRFEFFMDEALKEAQKAAVIGEVPIGAVIVKGEKVIGRGFNRRETDKDPTAHAEILAIRDAAQYLGGWRLTGCDIYVTIEPCPMCAGAMIMARLDRLVYGSPDHKAGAAELFYTIPSDSRLNHRMEVHAGIRSEECSGIISEFFKRLRQEKQVR